MKRLKAWFRYWNVRATHTVADKLDGFADPTCKCGHPRSKHGLHGFPDCTGAVGADFVCMCEGFQ